MRKRLICIFSLMIAVVLLLNIPIFGSVSGKYDDVLEKMFSANSDKNLYVLQYQYTTGASWKIIDSNVSDDKDFVAVKTLFDPRFLKINKDFDLDYSGKIIVAGDMSYSENGEYVINADKIYIYLNDKTETEITENFYKLKDMQFEGIIKMLSGTVFKKYQMSL